MQLQRSNCSQKKRKKQRLGDTSQAVDLKVAFLGYHDDTEIKYREDVGNFDYSKLMNQDAKTRKRILVLSASTHSMLVWFLFNLNYRNETVLIERKLVLKSGLSIALGTFKKAIFELEKAGLILRVGKVRTKEY